jgi:hypothetical protein
MYQKILTSGRTLAAAIHPNESAQAVQGRQNLFITVYNFSLDEMKTTTAG